MESIAVRSSLAGVALLVASVLLAGCTGDAGDEATSAATPTAPAPVGAWGGDALTSEPALALADDGTLTGTDGCNRLVGSWSDGDDTIAFDDVAWTRMACDGVDTWLSALASAEIDGSIMTVLDASGDGIGTLARSSAIDPATVPSGEAEEFIGIWGDASAPGAPSLVVAADGSTSGRDSCNSTSGTWGIDGGTLIFASVLSTQMHCDVDEWLVLRSTATVDGDTMTFFTGSGARIGTLTRTG